MTNPIDKHVGNRLSELRQEAGVTEQELAGFLGIPVDTLRQHESGERSIPALILFQVASLLLVSVDEFFVGVSDVIAFAEKGKTVADGLH